MKDNIKGADSQFVFIGFTFCMTVATILGALTAGIIGDIAGGYKDRKALFCTLVVFIIQMLSAVVCMSFSNKWVFMGGFFVMIFTENLVEPVFLGIMLTLVKPHEREVANSMSLFVQMLFGYIPSPYVYGLILDHTFIRGYSENPDPGDER